MRRYLRLYRVFVSTCLARELEFRGNFWANLITNTLWLFFFVAFIKVLYLNVPRVADWSEAEALTLVGTFGLIEGLFRTVAHQNLSRLPEQVRLGTLDFVITRPIHPQFHVSTRYVKLDSLGSVASALLVIAAGVASAGGVGDPARWLAFGTLLGVALVLYYSVYLALMTLAFWFVRVDNLAVLCEVIFDIGRYPVEMFGGLARALFTYALPLAFLASFPTRALFGKLAPGWIAWGIVLALALAIASSRFWRLGLRCYSSASS